MSILTPKETLQAISDGKNLEFKTPESDLWRPFNLDKPIFIGSIFNGCFDFRLAQEMITIGDVSFPKPESEAPELMSEYWVPNLSYRYYSGPIPNRWLDDLADRQRLRRGLVHLTRENATAHAKALLKLSGGTVIEAFYDCQLEDTPVDKELEDFINELNELSKFYIKLKSSDGNFKASDKMEELKSLKSNLIEMFKERGAK